MYIEKLCINCMKEKESPVGPCPYCGFDAGKYTVNSFQLPLYTKLSQRYIIGKVIGSGGFGITYIAYDTRLEIPVAIKELFVSTKVKRENARTVLLNTTQEGQRQYQDMKKRFMMEAKTLAELENVDGLVKVKDYFQENDTAYIVMEYLHGKDLKKKLLAEKRRMTIDQAIAMLEPVMQALEQMHKAGIIHRDISADNIMCLDDGRVKLIDLGGEKRVAEGALDEEMTVGLKKSSYSPIEQILGRNSDIGPWTDVYALSVCIYYCICGKLPKAAGDRKNDKDIELPSKLGVKLGKDQEQTLLKGMALDRKNRIQSVTELRQGLCGKYKRKSKKAVPIIVIAILLAVGSIGAYFIISGSGSRKPETEKAGDQADTGQTEDAGAVSGEGEKLPADDGSEGQGSQEPVTEEKKQATEAPTEPATEGEKKQVTEAPQEPVTEAPREPVAIEEGNYHLVSAASEGMSIHVMDNSNQNNAKMMLRPLSRDNYQIFHIIPDGIACRIKCEYSNRVLSVKDKFEGTGAALCQRSDTNDADQSWYFEPAGDNGFYIRSAYGTYIDMSTVDENGIRLKAYTGADQQKWYLEKAEE